jgi:hypothetical protein
MEVSYLAERFEAAAKEDTVLARIMLARITRAAEADNDIETVPVGN